MSTNFFNTKWSDRGALEKGLILGGSIFATIVLVRNSRKLYLWIKTMKENRTYSSDEDILTQFLMVNFAGVPQSLEHIEYVKSLL